MITRNKNYVKLENLSLFELIKHSIRSQECMENVKSMTTTRPLRFNIECVGTHFKLSLFYGEQTKTHNLSEDVTVHAFEMYGRMENGKEENFNGQRVLTSIDKENHISTYWNSPIEGIFFLLDYFSNLFNSPPIYELELNHITVETREKITSWIKNNRDSKVEYLNVGLNCDITTEELVFILDKVKPTAALDLRLKMNPDFRYELPRDLKCFTCFSSDWLTKENLMKMNYEFIDVEVEKFSYQDLTLQHCLIEAKDLKRNFKIIADGIDYDRTWSKLEVKVSRRKYASFFYNVIGIYDYERADGKTVTICASNGRDKHCVLHLYVWTK